MAYEIKCMYPRRVNPDMLQCLPLVRYSGEPELVETDEALDKALSEISKEKILGFDTETRPNFSKGKHYPVSILQLAGENKVWIIRLDPLASRLSDIFAILENPAIKKAGIAVQGDIKSLKARCPFNPAGFVDIAQSTRKIGVINTGMRNLAALIFGERLSKAAQLSNWASEVLDKRQLVYAATDAWMSRRLFLEVRRAIDDGRIILEPEPEPEPEHFSIREFIKGIFAKGLKKILGGANPSQKSLSEHAKKRRRNCPNAGLKAKSKRPHRNRDS